MREERDPDLAALLAAAAAPDPERDADERGLAAVLAAYREAADAPVRETDMMGAVEDGSASAQAMGRRAPRGRHGFSFTRALAVKCAALLVVLAGAGVAAASAGVLPAPIQRFAHTYFGGVGIPAPTASTPTAAASASATRRASPSRSVGPTATPESSGSASASPARTTPSELLALCEIVVQAGNSWHSDLDKAQRDLLIAAAGGNPQVLPYCTGLVASSGPSATASATSSGSGNGNGNGKGHPSKSPKTHPTK